MDLSDIPSRLRVLRRSQADLARHLGLDPSSLTKTIHGKRRVTPPEVAKIEAFLGERLAVTMTAPLGARRIQRPTKTPVYGYAAAGGEDRIAYADDQVLEYFDPPPFWNGSGELIYIRLVGDSMEPRYFSGEVVPVRLNLPPAKGQDALVLFNDATAVLKTYVGQNAGKVFVRQYNAPKEIIYEGSSVRSLSAVLKPGML